MSEFSGVKSVRCSCPVGFKLVRSRRRKQPDKTQMSVRTEVEGDEDLQAGRLTQPRNIWCCVFVLAESYK